jgi:ABC-type bacteriocin/lantibiotic exporter with double-glycine peptidase domain
VNIKIYLPFIVQKNSYSCGASCLCVICKKFNIDKSEKQIIKDTETMPKNGVTPENLIKTAKKYGLKVRVKENMTISDLERCSDQDIPVICDIQAWGSKHDFNQNESGHYVVVVGYTKTSILFMDPWQGKIRSSTKNTFLKNWHDENPMRKYHRLGIIISKPRPTTALRLV